MNDKEETKTMRFIAGLCFTILGGIPPTNILIVLGLMLIVIA